MYLQKLQNLIYILLNAQTHLFHKGKGVSFMENGVEWHHKVPSAAQVDAALKELGQA